MRISDVAKASKTFRQWRASVSLSESISRRLDYYRKHARREVRWSHEAAARAALAVLDTARTTPTCALSLTAWVISTSLSSRLMKHRTKDIMAEIFKGLRPPGKAQHNHLEQQLVEQMNDAGQQKRANQHRFLLMCEIAYRTKQNWFMVFNTLTVDRENHDVVFSKDSRAFYDYVRRFDNAVATATFGSVRKAEGDYHTYFACVEEGGNTGRLHIHVLHLCRQLPMECDDPNKGLPFPRLRELKILSTLWPYGYSSPVMVRYSPRDAYGLAGYRWPIDPKTGGALTIGSPLRVASYISKYITKGFNSCNRDKLLWRVRKTQRLGLNLLRMFTSELSPTTNLILATDDTMTARWNRSKIPGPILRLMALKTYLDQSSKNRDLLNITETAKGITPRLSPLQSLRASTRARDGYSRPNSGNFTIETLLSENAFNTAWTEMQAAAEKIEQEYFATTDGKYGTTATDDYQLQQNDPGPKIS